MAQPPEPQPVEPQDPHTVGRYRITGVLGAGGMGRVLLGVAPDGRRAAIKLVHRELAGTDGFRARFRREVALAAQAPPGWTAAFLDADPDAEQPWLATAYLDAPTLHQEIAESGTLSPDRAADLGVGLASALAALHARGLVHRDLKPSNVLLTGGGPRLIDFGISRAVDGTALTATGQVIGTPEYLSPEQITGTPPTGTSADLFALGSLLTFVVTAQTPFAGGTAAAVLSRVVHAEPALGPGLGRLEPVVRALLDKDPVRRPDAERAAELLAGGAHTAGAGGTEPAGPPAESPPAGHGPAGPAPVVPGGPFGPGGTRRSTRPWWTDGTAPGDGGLPQTRRPPSGAPSGSSTSSPDARGPERSAAATASGGAPGTRAETVPPTLVGAPPGPGEAWRRRRWLLVAGAVAVALVVALVAGILLSGGGDPDGAVAGPAETTTAPPPPPTPPTTTTAAADDLLAGATVVDLSEDVRYGDTDGSLRFRSPSGNIACVLEEFAARCDVLERTWEVPPVPASCRLAHGTGAELAGAAPGALTCVGDTVADPSLPVLEFDRALRSREVTCVSRRTGVECRNTTTGHGIAVARASYRIY
ncbi:serine/threonine-protein kinase [Pseudonocardia parietis]|uniref:Serine/threonine protein kinase n=1 Tax=Pseudonocardia parietis TaxID=570936 RepID=A0ABS4VTU9_9PSEU|nr:serine/threonine-protein kinase [Pseudonocardia parietis]MBP2367330.1 serine/threonine protein kinase [Pseudonocardia parietis]